MRFRIKTWAKRFLINQDTLDILKKEGLTDPQLIATLSQSDVEHLCATFGQRRALQNGIESLKEVKTRSRVFCVYTNKWEPYIRQEILPLLAPDTSQVKLLHSDAVPGENVFTFISRQISNPDTAVWVFFSKDIDQCPYCEAALREIPARAVNEERFIPIILEQCIIPHIFGMITSLEVNTPNFKQRLLESLSIRCNEQPPEDYVSQTVGKSLLNGDNDLALILKEKPNGPLKLFGKIKEKQRRSFRNRPFTPQCDNKLVFGINGKDPSKVSEALLKLNVVSCIQHMENGSRSSPDAVRRDKLIRIFKIHQESLRSPRTYEEREYGVRVCCPPDVKSMTISVVVRLSQNRDGEICNLYEDMIEFNTKEVKHSGETRKKHKPKLKGKMYDGDTEAYKDMGSHSTTKAGSLARTSVPENSQSPNECVNRNLRNRTKNLGILLRKDVRTMMLKLEQLGDDNKSEGFQPFYRECEVLIEIFTDQKRWSEVVLIHIKQAGLEHYRKNYSVSKSHLKKAWNIMDTQKIPDRALLEGRALYYLSAVYREKKKFGKAHECIEESIKALADREYGEDTAKAYYNKGKLQMKMIQSGINSDSRNRRQQIFETFAKAVDHFMMATTGVDFKQVRRCLLNMATLKADCPFSRLQHTTHLSLQQLKSSCTFVHMTFEDLKQAEGYLEDIEGRYWSNEVSRRNHMQILNSQAEVAFCKVLYSLVNSEHQDNNASSGLGDVIWKLEQSNAIGMMGKFKESETTSKLICQLKALKPECVMNERYITELGIPSDPDFQTVSMESDTTSDGANCAKRKLKFDDSSSSDSASLGDDSDVGRLVPPCTEALAVCTKDVCSGDYEVDNFDCIVGILIILSFILLLILDLYL